MCKVQYWFNDDPDYVSQWGVKNFYAGIQVKPTQIDMYSGSKPVDVVVSLTIPIVCRMSQSQCSVYVDLSSSRKDILIACPETIVFHSTTWNIPQIVKIKTKRDPKNTGTVKITVNVMIMPSESAVGSMWSSHIDTVITVC